MTLKQFKVQALKMFDGQFPNEILMRKVIRNGPMNEVYIRGELKEFILKTIDKYDELVVRKLDE